MNRKTLLLTGASGTVGTEILKSLALLTHQYEVTVFDVKSRQSVRAFKPYKNLFHIVFGDITQEEDVKKVCVHKDYVIHLAAVIPPLADDSPELARRVNVIGTGHLVRNLEQYSPETFFLYASSISVYGDRVAQPWISVTDPLAPSEGDEYALTKLEAEKIVAHSALAWSIFRLTAIMGRHKLSKLFFQMPLNTALEIATPAATAKAFVHALEQKSRLEGGIYNLGGGPAFRTSYKEFLTRSFKIFGLGRLNFPEKAFAERNFHCGYYKDGDVLESILHFQEGGMEDYYNSVTRATSKVKKAFAKAFQKSIKYFLLQQSEPYKAQLSNNMRLKKRFFYMVSQ